MRVIAYVIGITLLVIAVVYFLTPANQLPSFFPGFDAATEKVHLKHGLVSGVTGLVLITGGLFMRRRRYV